MLEVVVAIEDLQLPRTTRFTAHSCRTRATHAAMRQEALHRTARILT